jgi:hypothetical protein
MVEHLYSPSCGEGIAGLRLAQAKNSRPSMKNKLKQKGLEKWFK